MALRVVLLLAACDGGSALAASLRGVGRPLTASRPAPMPAVRMGVEDARMYVNDGSDVDPVFEGGSLEPLGGRPPFKKVMAANRAEIAVRIMRAATELNMATVAIYGYEDRYSQHRWGSDQSFQLEKEATASPISAYLDIKQIVQIALDNGVDAVHPGYGAPPLFGCGGCCRMDAAAAVLLLLLLLLHACMHACMHACLRRRLLRLCAAAAAAAAAAACKRRRRWQWRLLTAPFPTRLPSPHCFSPSVCTGFLSESPEFARALGAAGITFVGPTVEVRQIKIEIEIEIEIRGRPLRCDRLPLIAAECD